MRRRPAFTRAQRIEHLLHDEVIHLVGGELRDPLAAHLLVTSTHLSPDLGHLRIYYVMEGSDEVHPRAQQMLDNACGFVARSLRQSLQLKRTPKVVFTFDEDYLRMRRVRELLAEDRQRHAADKIDHSELDETTAESKRSSETAREELGASRDSDER